MCAELVVLRSALEFDGFLGSRASPPAGIAQWICGWRGRFWPQVENTDHADLGAEVFGVGRDLQGGGGTCAKQQVVEGAGVIQHQLVEFGGFRQLTWFDRLGKPAGTIGDPRAFFSAEFSPDRKTLWRGLR
jgi:hypothetical protein